MWYLTETPFGRIAYAVNSDGTLYVQPHSHSDALKPFADPVLNEEVMIPADEPSYGEAGRPVLTINGKEYGHEMGGLSFRVERSRFGGYSATQLPRHFSQSAYEKLSKWFTDHYFELVTPERLALAVLHETKSAEHYAYRDFKVAQERWDAAVQAHIEAAQNYHRITAGKEA